MRFVTDKEVEQTIFADPVGYFNYISERISLIADRRNKTNWADIKKKIIYDDPNNSNGDLRPMTCFTDRSKVVKVIATNPHRKVHPSISVGVTMLLDYEENYPIQIFDASALSSIRTAAMALWALQNVAYFDRHKRISLVGVGTIGGYFLKLKKAIIPDNPISFWDQKYHPATLSIKGQDIVVIATNSQTPVLNVSNCDAPLIVSVGADTRFNHELSHTLLRRHERKGAIYTDVREATEIGDLKGSGCVIMGDMFDAYQEQDATLFVSVGSPLMDALTVEYLHEHG